MRESFMDAAGRIFKLLNDKKISQKKFAEAIGTTEKVVSKWRTSGIRSYQKYLPQIAAELDVTLEYLLTGEGEQSPVKGNACEVLSPQIDFGILEQKLRHFGKLCSELAVLAQEICTIDELFGRNEQNGA